MIGEVDFFKKFDFLYIKLRTTFKTSFKSLSKLAEQAKIHLLLVFCLKLYIKFIIFFVIFAAHVATFATFSIT